MLTLLTSIVIMFAVVVPLITWAKREERRRMTAYEFDASEEVLASARDHQ